MNQVHEDDGSFILAGRAQAALSCRLLRTRTESEDLRGILQVDFDVVEIVLRVFADEVAILVGDFAAQLGGNAGPEGARRNDGVLGNDGAGGDDAALADAAVVQDAWLPCR